MEIGITEIACLALAILVFTYAGVVVWFSLALRRAAAAASSSPGLAVGIPPPLRNQRALPTVSVVIPARNEAANILACLDSMVGQDYPLNLVEYIVTDDHSGDYTPDYCRKFAADHPGFPLVIVTASGDELSGHGKKHALARAIQRARGEMVLCTDADTNRGASWVSSMAYHYSSGGYRMVMAPVAFSNEKSLLEKIQSLEFMGLMGITAATAWLQHPVMCNGANLGYQREAWLTTGGFDRNLGFSSGDDHFLMEAIGRSYGNRSIGFLFNREATVYTTAETTFRGFLNQRLRWVSKSRGYRSFAVLGLAMLTGGVHLLLLTALLTGLFVPKLLFITVLLWLVKIVAEFPVVRVMARFFEKEHLYRYYFVAQLFQLFYVPVVGLAGQLVSYSWKGRRLSR